MSYFYIMQPNQKTYKLIYNKETTFDDKIDILNKTILKTWGEYIDNRWFWGGKFGFHKNPEDKIKYMLGRASDFLLSGELNHEGLWTGYKKTKKIRAMENPVVSSSTLVEDMFYSSGNDSSKSFKKHKTFLSSFQEEYVEKVSKEGNSKRVRGYKKEYRKKIKRKYHLREIVDFNSPYESNWVSVDTDSRFEFLGDTYQIRDTVEAYKGTMQSNKEMFYSQDKILCYKQNRKYHFFDMEFEEVTEVEIID